MKTKPFLFLLFIGIVSFCLAQKKTLPLTGSILVGVVEGEQGGSLQMGATAGVKTKTWTTSIGTGLDYYGVRSIPLYLNVEKQFLNSSQTPFVYLNGGYHFPWLKNTDNSWWNQTKTSGGVYYGAGIGYRVPTSKQIALFFAAGYSFKQYREEITQRFECFMAPCPDYIEKLKHGFRRLSITTGLRF